MEKHKLLIGIEKTLENAIDLFEDARILIQNKSYCRAYALSQFCIEELGKIRIIFEIIIHEDEVNHDLSNKEIKKRFFSHKSKTYESIMSEFEISSRSIEFKNEDKSVQEEHIRNILKEMDKTKDYDRMKNESLYTGFEDGNFFAPKEKISTEQSLSRFNIAERRLTATKREIGNWKLIL